MVSTDHINFGTFGSVLTFCFYVLSIATPALPHDSSGVSRRPPFRGVWACSSVTHEMLRKIQKCSNRCAYSLLLHSCPKGYHFVIIGRHQECGGWVYVASGLSISFLPQQLSFNGSVSCLANIEDAGTRLASHTVFAFWTCNLYFYLLFGASRYRTRISFNMRKPDEFWLRKFNCPDDWSLLPTPPGWESHSAEFSVSLKVQGTDLAQIGHDCCISIWLWPMFSY